MFCGIPCTVNIMVISDPITLIHLPCRTAQTMFILPKMGFGGRMQGGSWTRRLVNLKTFRMATYWWSRVTISKFSMVPEKLLYLPNRKVVFKPPFFRGELLNFGGGSRWWKTQCCSGSLNPPGNLDESGPKQCWWLVQAVPWKAFICFLEDVSEFGVWFVLNIPKNPGMS